MRRLPLLAAGAAGVLLLGVAGTASAAPEAKPAKPPHPLQVRPALPAGATNPSIADGVAVGSLVGTYTASGLGPATANAAAPAGSPERFVKWTELPPGVTLTEAQSLNVFEQITANLRAQGLTLRDVISMRAYLSNPPGTDIADFAGWNRAYRQYFANTDLATKKVVPVPLGTAPPAAPIFVNPARPSRVTLEVANLPVAGWLVEVEVVAAYR
ncbi:Rid family hydrolase [Actinomadura flavalba]|uniref:Rid family hydrolase n=1 Tax=Actinomadura flavalba TaxID=1120938 RepID=UPI000375CF9A|nr:Rid family hydrolase [Actinomadura flavalba]